MTYDAELDELLGVTQTPQEREAASPAALTPERGDSTTDDDLTKHTDALEGDAASIPAVMNESELARLLDLSANRIRTLARDGIVIRIGRGKFDARASLQNYIQLLRKASNKGRPAQNDELKAEKIKVAKEQAAALELKNAALRGELVKANEVEREWSNIMRDIRAALLAVPSRCGARLPSLTAHDINEIDREIREALEGLADGT